MNFSSGKGMRLISWPIGCLSRIARTSTIDLVRPAGLIRCSRGGWLPIWRWKFHRTFPIASLFNSLQNVVDFSLEGDRWGCQICGHIQTSDIVSGYHQLVPPSHLPSNPQRLYISVQPSPCFTTYHSISKKLEEAASMLLLHYLNSLAYQPRHQLPQQFARLLEAGVTVDLYQP